MSARVTIATDFRGLVPEALMLPCEHSAAVISVSLAISDDNRVYSPGLEEIKAVLARGSTDVVRSYCEMWTRWLTRVEKAHAAEQPAVAP